MLRQVLKPSSRLLRGSTRRSFAAATSRQKRALNESQLKGKKADTPVSQAPPPPVAASTSEGGGGYLVPIVAVVAAGSAGAAYYMDMIPGVGSEALPPPVEKKAALPPKKEEKEMKAEKEVVKSVTETAPKKTEVVKSVTETAPKKKEAMPVSKAAPIKKEVIPAVKAAPKMKVVTPVAETTTPKKKVAPAAPAKTGNRVLNIVLPSGTKRSAPPAAVTEHPIGGNKVAMEPMKAESENEPTVDAALQELQAQLSKDTSRALNLAHQELAQLASIDVTELDSMNKTQLKIRLVQMAKDIEERTKWEAVRLKEFLAMKEKEVEDKYVLMIKKQQLESESLMEKKLSDQERTLTSKAQTDLREKEEAMQAIIDHSLKIQEQQFNEEKVGFEKMTEEAMNAKYEELYGKSLVQAKEGFAKKVEQKAKQIEGLAKKLSDLEFALQSTKEFQSGSVEAHRMSAAALALVDALESSKPAGAALTAMRAVAENNAVVNVVLDSLPLSVSTKGVSTLQELQTSFEEKIYPKCRRATLVPDGYHGMEGQLLGIAFAALKYPPSPDDPAPDSEKDASEYVLSRARRHIQLGELEQAAEQMVKLQGQALFTARDWLEQTKERVAVEKALKVLRMECVLANKSMSKLPGSS